MVVCICLTDRQSGIITLANRTRDVAPSLGTGRSTAPTDLRVPQTASLYVARPSATDPTVAPPGHENLFLLVPFPADPSIGAGEHGRAELDAHADR